MFSRRFSNLMSTALIAGALALISLPATAFAAPPERPGYSPASAAAPDSALHMLQPGQWDWYVFKAQIPPLHDLTASQRLENNRAMIDVAMNIQQGVGNFEVWNAQTLRDWLTNVKYTPFGQGTENSALKSDPLHYWAGSFNFNGAYYLVVKNKGNTPMEYSLNISDENVTFPSNLMVQSVK